MRCFGEKLALGARQTERQTDRQIETSDNSSVRIRPVGIGPKRDSLRTDRFKREIIAIRFSYHRKNEMNQNEYLYILQQSKTVNLYHNKIDFGAVMQLIPSLKTNYINLTLKKKCTSIANWFSSMPDSFRPLRSFPN